MYPLVPADALELESSFGESREFSLEKEIQGQVGVDFVWRRERDAF